MRPVMVPLLSTIAWMLFFFLGLGPWLVVNGTFCELALLVVTYTSVLLQSHYHSNSYLQQLTTAGLVGD